MGSGHADHDSKMTSSNRTVLDGGFEPRSRHIYPRFLFTFELRHSDSPQMELYRKCTNVKETGTQKQANKLRGLCPRTNYTDRATAA
jgi:hypothetical protein